MSDFAFRISVAYDEVKLDDLFDLCNQVIIYQHTADDSIKRTHIHGLIFGCTRKEDTVRNKFFKGKYEYSMKTKVDDKFITYMSKGKLDPVFIKGFDSDLVRQRKSEWQDHRITPTVEVSEKTSNKKTKKELLSIMLETYESHWADADKKASMKYMSLDSVLRHIRKVLIANNEVIGMYKVMDYYDSFMMFGNEEGWLQMVANKINSRSRI